MSRFEESVNWDGVYYTFVLFAVYEDPPVEEPVFSLAGFGEHKAISSFELEDEDGILGNKQLVVYDIICLEMPEDVTHFLKTISDAVLAAGATACWVTSEGAFSFKDLLNPEDAQQIYFFRSSLGSGVAIEDEALESDAWKENVARFREAVL